MMKASHGRWIWAQVQWGKAGVRAALGRAAVRAIGSTLTMMMTFFLCEPILPYRRVGGWIAEGRNGGILRLWNVWKGFGGLRAWARVCAYARGVYIHARARMRVAVCVA